MNRILLALSTVLPLGMIAQTAGAQVRGNPPVVVLWACYVPLTGTVYRISPDGSEPGLRTACSSAAHVKFSWNEQGPPGVSGYEVVTSSVQKTYLDFVTYTILGVRCSSYVSNGPGQPVSCSGLESDSYASRAAYPSPGVDLACPAGKKVISAVADDGVLIRIATDGSSANFQTNRESRVTDQHEGPETPSYPGPPDTPETFNIQLVCAWVI